MGFAATMSRAVIFGDQEFGGLSMTSYYCEQGIAKTLRAISHVRDDSNSSKLFIIGLSHWSTVSGTAQCLFTDHRSLPQLEQGWYTAVRSFIRRIEIKLHITVLPKRLNPRAHDINIMEAILDVCSESSKIRAGNRVRLYIWEHWISDITNGAWTHLLTKYFNRSAPRIPTKQHCPNQGCPGISDWSIWRTLLYKAVSADGSGRLVVPLGPWAENIFRDSVIKWKYWAHNDYLLWTNKENHIMTVQPIPELWPALRYDLSSMTWYSVQDVKYRVVPATVQVQADSIIGISCCLEHCIGTEDHLPTTVHELINRAYNPGIQYYLKEYQILSGPLHWQSQIEVFMASTHKNTGGVFSWVAMQESKQIAEGQGSEAGVFDYRMGLAAITVAVAVSTAIKRHHKIRHQTQIRIHTQVPAIISRVKHMVWDQTKSMPNKCLKLEWDLEYAITASLKIGKITLIPVLCPKPKKGEKGKPQWPILFALQQKVRSNLKETKLERLVPVTCKAFITCQWRPVTRNEGHLMRKKYHTKLIQNHLMKRYQWFDSQWLAIDWEGFKSAYHSLPLFKHWQITKFWFGWLPVGQQMVRRNLSQGDLCPTCKRTSETGQHIIQCFGPGTSRESIWQKWHNELASLLEKSGTKPEIRSELLVNTTQ